MSRIRTTKKQLEAMICFIEANPALGCNKKLKNSEKDLTASKWEELKTLLNNLDGPVRTTKEWKQVFTDLKTNTRRRARQKKYDLKRTGGGDANEKDLTELEQRVLGIDHSLTIDGAPGVEEPGVEEPRVEEPRVEELGVEKPVVEKHTPQVENKVNNMEVLRTDVAATSLDNISSRNSSKSDNANVLHKKGKRKLAPSTTGDDMKKLIKSQEIMAASINNLAKSVRILANNLKRR